MTEKAFLVGQRKLFPRPFLSTREICAVKGTFITNEPGKSLRDRLGVLLSSNTRYFDCLVGYLLQRA